MIEGPRHPALSGVHIFLAAAEHGSFTRAAAILGLPQSSVTRQIAALEDAVGCRLFERHRRGALLTREGTRYRDEVKPAVDRIWLATRRLRRRDTDRELRLRVYPTFATRWLLRRLQAFNTYAPGVTVSLDAAAEPVDFDCHDVDLAIQFGNGQWHGAAAELLFPDEVESVCTPDLLRRLGPFDAVEHLSKALLLQSRYRRDDWKDWLAANTELWPQLRTMEFGSSVLTFQACLDGLGVAMGQPLLLESELGDGRLLRPMQRPLRRAHLGYYLISPAGRQLTMPARRFAAWMREMAAV